MKKLTFILLFSSLLISSGEDMVAKILTSKGEILIELEFKKTPLTVANFVGLAEGLIENSSKALGEPYYNGIKFHRVIDDFMIQGGDPTGTGRGGPGYKFADEFHPDLKHDKAGILSMANSGPGTNGSQFFITHKATPWLDNKHSVFGHVIEGQNVVNNIVKDDLILSISIEKNSEEAKNFDASTVFKEEQDKALLLEQEKQKKQEQEIANLTQGAITTASGLKYIILKKGEGPKPVLGQTVKVHYAGYLINGTQFDSSIDRNKPFEFELGGRVIQGWNEGIALLNVGAKAKFIIPPNLGYGPQGAGGVIPPNATLIFDVELLEILEPHHHDHSDPNHKH